MGVHARLKNKFTRDEKSHNLMSHFVHFRTAQPSILSYKYQQDEGVEEDTVSLPYQASADKQRDSMDNFSDSGSFDSTHFDKHPTFVPGSLNSDYMPGSINRHFNPNPKV